MFFIRFLFFFLPFFLLYFLFFFFFSCFRPVPIFSFFCCYCLLCLHLAVICINITHVFWNSSIQVIFVKRHKTSVGVCIPLLYPQSTTTISTSIHFILFESPVIPYKYFTFIFKYYREYSISVLQQPRRVRVSTHKEKGNYIMWSTTNKQYEINSLTHSFILYR